MNFSELYNNNRTAVERALVAMWCGESNNDSQRSYIKQMKTLIGNLFAPENAVPVVQCMNSYIPVAPEKLRKPRLWWANCGTLNILHTSTSINAGMYCSDKERQTISQSRLS